MEGKKSKRTIEIYRDLLQVEVRALVGRVAELTSTVNDLFTEVNNIALQLEESVAKSSRVNSGLSYCREEMRAVRKVAAESNKQIKDVQARVENLEKQLKAQTSEN